MKLNLSTLLFLVVFILWKQGLMAQYFQQEIKYSIDGLYDKKSHEVTADITVSYTNNAPQSLDTLYINLWANAFKSKTSPYTEQAIKLGNTDFYFAPKSNEGGYTKLEVLYDNQPLTIQYKETEETAYIILNTPLKSGETATIKFDYILKMPYRFGRFGWYESGVQLVHWYPSMAVFDSEGWHHMHYLSMGELYSDIATYEVKLELPYSTYTSTSPLDGTAIDGVVDYAIIADNNYTLDENKIGNTPVFLMHQNNPTFDNEGFAELEKVFHYLEKNIGPYPYPSLSLVEKDKSGGMEYSGLVTLGAKDRATYLYYMVHELIHQWFYGSLVTNQRESAWLDEGFTTYFQQRYYTDQFGYDHYTKLAPSLHGVKDGLPLLQKVAMAQAYRAFDQPICTHIDKSSALNYGFNSYEIPARWIGHLEAYLSRETFDKAVQQLYKDWKGKHPSEAGFRQIFESASGKDLTWFFDDIIYKTWATDYKISKQGNTATIRNNSLLPAPYTIETTLKSGEQTSTWQEGHIEAKEVQLTTDYKKIKIGPETGLLDKNPNNNQLGNRPIKIVPGIGLDDTDYHEIYTLPLVNYNTSDGLGLGMALFNSTLAPKRWKYMIAPQYAFGSGNLTGHAWTSYDYYTESPWLRKVFFKLGVKSYNSSYSEVLDDHSRYLKVDPSISLHFRNTADSHVYDKLTFKSIYIKNYGFALDGQSLGRRSSLINQLKYEYFNFYELAPMDAWATLEYQDYTNGALQDENYLKLTTSLKKSWLYRPNKKVSFRLFAGYFLSNSRRNATSFDPQLTRGSMALIHQGYNDYAYDEYWFNRGNQNQGIWGQQVSFGGGGFKTPIGSQFSVGQSNDLAAALNFESDLPFNLPRLLPLAFYADVGYYTVSSNSDLMGRTLFNCGLALNYGEGLFSVYLPIYSSSGISDNLVSRNFLNKISFRIDINRFNPWELVEDYNF